MNLVFIGFTSCGKSATAREVGAAFELDFVDMDREIEFRYEREKGERLPYRDIIRREGYDFFLDYEHMVLEECAGRDGCAFAPGGGAPIHERNRPFITQMGRVVYLHCQPEILLERMRVKGLPLYLKKEDDSLAALKKIWNERLPIYREMADMTVDNSSLDLEETVAAVLSELNNKEL